MRLSLIALAAVITCCSLCTPGHAGWKDFWHRVSLDWHRNNCWPDPFCYEDREAVRAPLAAMVNKGWQLQNTLSNHHFDPQTHHLTRSAQLKIEAILTQSPPQRRTIFVVRSIDHDITAARIDAVQESLTRMLPQGGLPPVVESENVPIGSSADSIYAMLRKFEPPTPALPSSDGGGN